MRSSTSNSDIHLTRRFIPGGRWALPLGIALLIATMVVGGEEYLLARRGFAPTIVDSASIWARQRARASWLGRNAIILIGASRIQLDVDLDTMRDLTGKEPVQLAIDGSSFVPVLADLASDDQVTGTIIVDYQDHVIDDLHLDDGAPGYLAEWQRFRSRRVIPDFLATEAWLGDQVHRQLRSFADGATPFRSLAMRAMDPKATPQYLITLPSRERRADYTRVSMPQFYYSRVMRNAGFNDVPTVSSWTDLDEVLTHRVEALPPSNLSHFGVNAEEIAGMVRRIEARGGHVVFVMFPRSGLVRATDERKFPRDVYWDRFVRIVHSPALNYRDVPSLASFVCPDGSHLDVRDQAAFTRGLVNALFVRRDDHKSSGSPMASVPSKEAPNLEQVR